MNDDKGYPYMMEANPIELIHAFANPICKQTFDSLPKIYGKKKKKPLSISPSMKIHNKNYFISS